MKKAMGRLLAVLLVLVLIIGGGIWWFLSYIAPDQERDLSYQSIDVGAKALEMIRALKPELVLSEADVNSLIKRHMEPEFSENIKIDGADFKLEKNRLLADLNITFAGRIPAEIKAEYDLEWKGDELVLHPASLHLKGITLPSDRLETIVVPLGLPSVDIVKIKDIQFETGQIKVLFQLDITF
ncbi:hypothetical protein ACX93W_20950 [Paenibacillus sp. CAU 1782]